jgi:hypothetical protein
MYHWWSPSGCVGWCIGTNTSKELGASILSVEELVERANDSTDKETEAQEPKHANISLFYSE